MFMVRRRILMLGVAIFWALPSQGQTLSGASFMGTWESRGRKALLVVERIEGPFVVGKFSDLGTEPLGAQWIKGKQGSARIDDGVLKITLSGGNNLELTLAPDGKTLSGPVIFRDENGRMTRTVTSNWTKK